MMQRFLSVPPAIYEQGWWPTPRWALRRLAMYGIAALSGGLLFVVCAALLAVSSPPRTSPNSTIPIGTTGRPAASPVPSIKKSPSVPGARESINLIAVMTLLENKDNDPRAINEFVNKERLSEKYPYGFAIFYSDIHRILHYGTSSASGISFDPTILQVKHYGDMYCLNLLPVKIRGKILYNIQNICLNGRRVMHVARIDDVGIDVEPLASSVEGGIAWVIGMKPA